MTIIIGMASKQLRKLMVMYEAASSLDSYLCVDERESFGSVEYKAPLNVCVLSSLPLDTSAKLA